MPKFSKCSCEHCGAHLEFPEEAAGAAVECPHCHGQTALTKSEPWVEQAVSNPVKHGRPSARFAGVLILVLVAGSLGAWAVLKKNSTAKTPSQPAVGPRASGPKAEIGSVMTTRASAPPPSDAAVPAVGEIKKGREVYMGKCAKCHQFYDPAAYNDVDWNHWMGRMRGEAKLNGDQADLLNRFLAIIRHP